MAGDDEPGPLPGAYRTRRAWVAANRAELARLAAELRGQGRPWSRVAAELGLPLSTARTLALEGGA